MARLRTTNKHLPKYVTIIHGSYWYRAPKAKPIRIAAVGEEQALYEFMAKRAAPVGPITTMNDLLTGISGKSSLRWPSARRRTITGSSPSFGRSSGT